MKRLPQSYELKLRFANGAVEVRRIEAESYAQAVRNAEQLDATVVDERDELCNQLATATEILHGYKRTEEFLIKLLELARALLAEARSSVSYQAGMQNLNTDAGKAHAARLNERLERIDAVLGEHTTPDAALPPCYHVPDLIIEMQAVEPQPDTVRVPTETLRRIHRDLDSCQKVIWLAGCRPRGYGFDPAYVTDAQARLKEIEALLASDKA